jgi:putative tricarboxylic transport membrane protein
MPLYRLPGLAVAGFGLALLFFIIPDQVEVVDYGWVRPETVPNVVAVALILLGLLDAATSKGEGSAAAFRPALKAFFFLAYAAAAVWAMGRFGFVVVAPVMMLVLMLLIGERRPLWLGLGTVAVPGVVWATVVLLLDRTLPG